MTLPAEFESYTCQLMGEGLYATLAEGLQRQPEVSLRVNPMKCPEGAVHADVDGGRVPWAAAGHYLKGREAFTFDPLLHAGAYYVQEASSMIVDHLVRHFIRRPVTMLDLCSAPGGKSIAARSLLPEGSLLVSNEPVRSRADILVENIQKFGHPDCIVTNNYPRDYKRVKLQFDAILADVPCSGEGMFRKDEGAIAEWSPSNVDRCWRLQREIVADVWPSLKPGGLLFYSTCTFNAHENEENVAWIAHELGADVLDIPVEEAWNITPALTSGVSACRFIPGKTRGEGLFVAVLRKHGEGSEGKKKGNADKKQVSTFKASPHWLLHEEQYLCLHEADTVRAIPASWAAEYKELATKLHVLHAGVPLGTLKGKALLPDEALALSTQLRRDAFAEVPLSYEEAIAYLRKEAVTMPEGTPLGPVVVSYQGMPLGFVKNIGNRANNLYPQNWKIKSSHLPEKKPNIIQL